MKKILCGGWRGIYVMPVFVSPAGGGRVLRLGEGFVGNSKIFLWSWTGLVPIN